MSSTDPPRLRLPATPRGVWTLQASLPVTSLIKLSSDLLSPSNPDLLRFGEVGPGARRFVVVDEVVQGLYGDRIAAYFDHHGVTARIVGLRCSEADKDVPNLMAVLAEMEAFKLARVGEPVLAIGGGILLDVAGLAATLYRRGVPYVRVPTTLLALVDASVGVKTGINYLRSRNRLGSYYAPVASWLDRSFLRTLPAHELVVGMGEILKMAVVKDRELFDLFEAEGPACVASRFQEGEAATRIVERSIQGMVEDLEPNLWEKDMKRLVNFGHSFSPIIEMRSGGALAHGEAVALDVLYSCVLSRDRGLLPDGELRRVFGAMRAVGLPTFHEGFADVDLLEESLADTTRHRNGAQELPIPVAIGRSVFFDNVRRDELARAARGLRELSLG